MTAGFASASGSPSVARIAAVRQPVRQQVRAPAHQQRIHDRQIARAETQTERVCRQPDERNRRADGGTGSE